MCPPPPPWEPCTTPLGKDNNHRICSTQSAATTGDGSHPNHILLQWSTTALLKCFGGVFAQRGHSVRTAPIITLFIPGKPLHTTPLQKRA